MLLSEGCGCITVSTRAHSTHWRMTLLVVPETTPLSSAISSLLFVIQPRHGPGDVEGAAHLPPHRQPEAAGWFAYNENQLFLRTLHT